MFELSGVNYEEVLEQGDSILVRVIASSSYRGFELSGLYCKLKVLSREGKIVHAKVIGLINPSGWFPIATLQTRRWFCYMLYLF